ncbi:unnamed protein product [Paramecium sonneborni]|uniref:Uncharacterized protein n=1 Tax=Paramecium sonneborni TaxID=65129 RepID=A0A8S1RMN1_9CILI|nr:unnamed protein product [Paramecium sonneborni]
MLFEKFKIYNNPAKLLEKFCQVSKIYETLEKEEVNKVQKVQKTEPSQERYLGR